MRCVPLDGRTVTKVSGQAENLPTELEESPDENVVGHDVVSDGMVGVFLLQVHSNYLGGKNENKNYAQLKWRQ